MSPGSWKSTRAVGSIFVAAAAAAVIWPLSVNAQEYRGRGTRTLEGTWWVQVTALSDCTSRTPLGSFAAMLTFARGGTMTGTTTNPVFAAGQRSPDHGVWFRAGAPRAYRASSAAFLLFTTAPNPPMNPGFQAGSQRLDQAITLTDADHFTSDAVTQFFDASGHKYREGCASAVARRFE
jgi:hypothetical protein